ncbi:MAG: aminodeoxychorismate synthase component I [Steroidobacter sp.]
MAAGPILQPVDLDPAALLALHAAWPDRYPALFESAAAGQPLGRFDILFASPGARLTLHRDGSLTGPVAVAHGKFLRALDQWLEREQAPTPPGAIPFEIPFTGGWLLYLGYELAGEIEPRLRLHRPASAPIAQAVRIPAAVVHEHGSGRSWIVAEGSARSVIERIASDIANVAAVDAPAGSLVVGPIEEEDPRRYVRAVEKALDYISAGDIYQANLSRRWRARLRDGVTPQDVYRRLRETNPGPFSGSAVLDDITVISSSPERLVEVRGGSISTRPIAGTHPRGASREADLTLARELHEHPKERAEHIMLIDLERNDLGRVCEAGAVHVDEFMTIESYAHVHHIVSNVRGRLRAGVTTGEVLAAVFPGGTITGCPKVRCMEIIAELENEARGPYTGSLGYLNLDGGMDMNILIRSIEVRGRELSLRAGAGIVADSVSERELAETRAKARGVLRALGAEANAP